MATNIPVIIKENYFSGQILQVEDFKTEQEFHAQQRCYQTRQLFSPGVLTGLQVTGKDKTITVAEGAALDEKGQQILLTTAKILDVTENDGDYQLIISEGWIALDGMSNKLKSDPGLKLTAVGVSTQEGVLLAKIAVANGILSILDASAPVEILSTRIPKQVITDLDASVIKTGIFESKQIPELQKLSGKITSEQLPSDIGTAKEYISFFANKTIVQSGSSILFSWKTDNGVESLSLDYYSETGINTILSTDGGIQLNQSDFSVQPHLTTTYTLTAWNAGVAVAQKQLTITVITLKGLVELQFQGHKTAEECVAQIKNQFPIMPPQESAIALAQAGYLLYDTGSAIKNGFNITDASEFGKIMSNAFPS